jgi:hypothetical protein
VYPKVATGGGGGSVALGSTNTGLTLNSGFLNLALATATKAGALSIPDKKKIDDIYYVSVKDFGAVGNDVANDTAAIQTALSAAVASTSGKRTIYFPPGIYRVGPLVITGLNFGSTSVVPSEGAEGAFTIMGSPGAILRLIPQDPDTKVAILTIADSALVRVRILGLRFEGNNAASGQIYKEIGINTYNSTGVGGTGHQMVVKDCFFFNLWRCFMGRNIVESSASAALDTTWNCRFLDCEGQNIRESDFVFSNAFHVEISNFVCENEFVPPADDSEDPGWLFDEGGVAIAPVGEYTPDGKAYSVVCISGALGQDVTLYHHNVSGKGHAYAGQSTTITINYSNCELSGVTNFYFDAGSYGYISNTGFSPGDPTVNNIFAWMGRNTIAVFASSASRVYLQNSNFTLNPNIQWANGCALHSDGTGSPFVDVDRTGTPPIQIDATAGSQVFWASDSVKRPVPCANPNEHFVLATGIILGRQNPTWGTLITREGVSGMAIRNYNDTDYENLNCANGIFHQGLNVTGEATFTGGILATFGNLRIGSTLGIYQKDAVPVKRLHIGITPDGGTYALNAGFKTYTIGSDADGFLVDTYADTSGGAGFQRVIDLIGCGASNAKGIMRFLTNPAGSAVAVEQGRLDSGGMALVGPVGINGQTPPARAAITGNVTTGTLADLQGVVGSLLTALNAIGLITKSTT